MDWRWFIHQLEVLICFSSSTAWPCTWAFPLCILTSSLLWTDTIVCAKLNKPPSQISAPSPISPLLNVFEIIRIYGSVWEAKRMFSIVLINRGNFRLEGVTEEKKTGWHFIPNKWNHCTLFESINILIDFGWYILRIIMHDNLRVQSTLSKTDTFETGTKSPS